MTDLWNSMSPFFNSFDGFTYAMMAIVAVGAGFMMPSMAAIVTTTVTSLAVFALAVFSRGVLGAPDSREFARTSWSDLLSLPLQTLLLYSALFAFVITVIHGLRMLSKP